MAMTLFVDGARWRAHVEATWARASDAIPVVKGNGYGLGRPKLAAVAAGLGADALAVGTTYEVASVRARTGAPSEGGRATPDVIVMTPALAHDLAGVEWIDDHVVPTVGSAAHVEELVRGRLGGTERQPTRVVVKLASSMRRYGASDTTLADLLRAVERAGLAVAGFGLHLPLPEAGADAVGEIESWLPKLPGDATLHVSHVEPAALDALRERHPSRRLRLRIGTALWHGDKSAFRLQADVLEVRPVRAGDPAGYRLTAVPADGHLVLIGAGTTHGVQPLADDRSPFHFARKRLGLLEAPHMHTSMAFVAAGEPRPEVGELVDVQRPLTQTWPDRVVEIDDLGPAPANEA